MDDHRNREDPYVGYGNPPKHTRFKKGRSGNPKGRPKGTLNMATVLERTLRERVVIVENGTRKSVTKLEAALKQLVNQAASGNLAAMRQLSSLVESAEKEREADQDPSAVAEADKKIMDRLLGKLSGNVGGNDDLNQ
jgi:hypothetical protein